MTPYAEGKRWRLYAGDCLDVLAGLDADTFDVVATDSPYGINTKSDGLGKLSPWADLCNSAHWYTAWIGECRRVLRPTGGLWTCLNWRSIVTFQKSSADLRWPIDSMLVWDKRWIGPGARGLRSSYEMVALWLAESGAVHNRGLADVQPFAWSSVKPNGHPAEKPESLMAWLIAAVAPPDRPGAVLDPFCGSGTTGVAALRRGDTFVGVEMDLQWADIAARRLAQAEADGVVTPLLRPEREPEVEQGRLFGKPS